MKIKRYHAADMRQAIRKVREELGPDAVILSNTRVNGGTEIVAAVDYDESLLGGSADVSGPDLTLSADRDEAIKDLRFSRNIPGGPDRAATVHSGAATAWCGNTSSWPMPNSPSSASDGAPHPGGWPAARTVVPA